MHTCAIRLSVFVYPCTYAKRALTYTQISDRTFYTLYTYYYAFYMFTCIYIVYCMLYTLQSKLYHHIFSFRDVVFYVYTDVSEY